MDRKTVQEWKKQDERRTYGEDRFPGLAAMQISPFTRLENLQTRLSIRSSFVKPSTSREKERERERERDGIRFPCSDASIKYSIQQVRIVAK